MSEAGRSERTHLEELWRLVVQVRIVPDRVEDNVERLVAILGCKLLDEVRLLVVEDVVGREALDELTRGRGASRDDVGAVGFGELYGRGTSIIGG